MARARRAHAGLTVYPPSRTLELSRFIRQKKAEVSKRQYSSKAKGSNVRNFVVTKNTVLNLVHAWKGLFGIAISVLSHPGVNNNN